MKDAFLLHRRHFRETSLTLDVFSREAGTVRLIAKGALRARRGWSTLLQPFAPLSINWTNRGDPPLLTGAESRGEAIQLAGTSLLCGFYMNELLIRFLPYQDPHPEIFAFYEQSLGRLDEGGYLEETLRFFELRLMQAIGYGPVLDHDTETGDEIIPDRYYLYRLEHGPVRSEAISQAVRGSTLLGLRDGRLSGHEEISEAKRLMRRVINHHLGDRPLKSRELFKYMTIRESR